MNRLIIVGLAISPPGTMGGNSKIMLEYARHLPMFMQTVFILPSSKRPAYDSVARESRTEVIEVEDYSGSDKRHPVASVRHYTHELRRTFDRLGVTKNDFVLTSSESHIETVPLFFLQKDFGFQWLPSMFLFVPGPIENVRKRYGFPLLKYIVYYFYQRLMFLLQKARGSAFVVTNQSDFVRFPPRFKNRLYAAYGGVNIEQIPADCESCKKLYDAVFCSRLHPQKGVSRLLDIWRIVLDRKSDAKIAIIGNGDPSYEKFLKDKAQRLGLTDSIEWMGYVNGEEKYRVYRQAKLLTHATIYDNNGMVAAEALCTGLPVVMSDIPALRSLYTTGCRKVPYGDNSAFAEAILDPGVTLSAEDRDMLRKRWSWFNRAREFKAFLDCL